MKNFVWSFLVVMILASAAVCQPSDANQPLVNQSVVEMVQAGLPEEIIISKIRTSPVDFELSTKDLVSLGKQKVPNSIVKAMLEAQSQMDNPQAAAAEPESADPNSPESPHDAGIYMLAKTGSGPKMTLLEPTVYTQGRSGGVFASAMTYGIAKVKWRAVLRGARAQVRSNDPAVVFYFYFEKTSAGLSSASWGTSTPNEFTILRLEEKKDSRETVVMEANAFGASSGSDQKKVIPFDFVRLRAGVYKVTPKAPLSPGEYGIIGSEHGGAFAAGAETARRMFDFGMDAPQ